MRTGNLTLASLVSLFCAVGCGGGTMDDIESMTEEVCACEDKECVDDVKESYKGKIDKEELEALSAEEKVVMLSLGEKAMGCEAKLQ